MQGRIIFLLEEPSMKGLIEHLLPRMFPGWMTGQQFLCVSHEGKSDLDRSIPRKLANWHFPNDRFVIVRDNDNANGPQLKAKFVAVCAANGKPNSLVRLVCQELEAWYLGDLAALGRAFDDPKIDSPANRKKFIDPDSWQKPSVEVKRLAPSFQKGSGARIMGDALDVHNNRSNSFRVFINGITNLASQMGYPP